MLDLQIFCKMCLVLELATKHSVHVHVDYLFPYKDNVWITSALSKVNTKLKQMRICYNVMCIFHYCAYKHLKREGI